MNQKSYTIKQNKKGQLLYMLGAVLMSCISLLIFMIDFKDIRSNSDILQMIIEVDFLYILFKGLLLIGFLFFGIGFISMVKKYKDGKDFFVVDETGITDNTSSLAVGFIDWNDIVDIKLKALFGNQFIIIDLLNEDKYLQKMNILQKVLMKVNKKMGYSIVSITMNSTGKNIKEVYEITKTYQHAYQLNQ